MLEVIYYYIIINQFISVPSDIWVGFLKSFIPPIFVANIAAITLSGSFFQKLESYEDEVCNKTAIMEDIMGGVKNNFVPNVADITKLIPDIDRSINEICCNRKRDRIEKRVRAHRGYVNVYFSSEILAILSIIFLCIHTIYNAVLALIIAFGCFCISLILFITGLVIMVVSYNKKIKDSPITNETMEYTEISERIKQSEDDIKDYLPDISDGGGDENTIDNTNQ